MPNLIYEWTAHHKLCIQTNNWYETFCSDEQLSLTLFFRRTAVSNLDKRTNSWFHNDHTKGYTKQGLILNLDIGEELRLFCPLYAAALHSSLPALDCKKMKTYSIMYYQGIPKRCRLWPIALVYEPKCGEGRGLQGLSQWVQLHCKSRPSQYELHIPWKGTRFICMGKTKSEVSLICVHKDFLFFISRNM